MAKKRLRRKYGLNSKTYISYQKKYQYARNKATKTFYEQASKARIISGDSSRVYKPYAFKYVNFKTLVTKGVDVYSGGKKVKTITGLAAVKHRIKQLGKYQSSNAKVENWIKNYVAGLRNVGMPTYLVAKIRNRFRELDPNYLSYLITIGNIPDFSFIYDGDDATEKYQEIMDRIWYYSEDKSNKARYAEIERQSMNKAYIRQEGKFLKQLDKATKGRKWKPL